MYIKVLNIELDVIRWLRLLAGAALLISGFVYGDGLTAMLGGLFLFQGIMNVSCSGASGCKTAPSKSLNSIENIEFEEIKK
jgi:hypothetical protein